MRKRLPTRITSLLLTLILVLAPAAHALSLEQARELISTYYIDEVPGAVLSQPTIADMIHTLGDPYTQYFTPEEYTEFMSAMEDTSSVGIGITFTITDEGALVQSVYADTPAAEVGLLPGDLLTAADGISMAHMDGDVLLAALKGEVDTQVRLTFLREGKTETVTLTRRVFTIPTTVTQVLDDHIGYIDCRTFGNDTYTHFSEDVATHRGQVDHWIINLMDNGGGLLTPAMQSLSVFNGAGTMVYLRNSTGAVAAYGADSDSLTMYPVIALSNGQTASSSEIFCANIRDYNTGIVVGERTFGKGVAQQIFDQTTAPDYFGDGSAMKITTDRFYAPSANTNDTVGVIPHLVVDETLARSVAHLLSGSNPTGDNEGMLRVDLGWRWHIDLDTALSDDYRAAFTALMEAIPPNVRVLEGGGGSDNWTDTTPQAVAEQYGLTEYAPRGFSDTASSPFAEEIQVLATYGLIQGGGDGTYGPEGVLTRAQLCALLAQALGCTVPTGDSRFTDVDMDAWYGPAVNALAQMGLVTGAGGVFRPDDPVDHQQLITILGRTARRLNLSLALTAENRPEDALDLVGLIPYADWAREGVWLLGYSQQGFFGNTINLLWDEVNGIDPKAATTREEAAGLLYNILSATGILPA